MTLAAGTKLGPYEILAPLGAGGMGEVYKARDTRLGREVAIKVLPEAFANDAERLSRFEREARSASSLSDPHIVTVFDVGAERGIHYFASELVDGSDLRRLLDEGAVAIRKALDLAEQIASGLAAAHEKGIVHRDLKPENILLTRSGLAKIADFGLAKLTETAGSGISQMPTSDGRQTTAGVVMGTAGYMSPEQASGRKVDYRSDQFSFGVILFELLTGKLPFRRGTPGETLAAILRDDAPAVSDLNSSVPGPAAWVVERCLAKDPDDRYASTRDLAWDVSNLRRRLPEIAGDRRPGGGGSARRRRETIAWSLAAAAFLAALAAVFFVQRGTPAALPGLRFTIAPPKDTAFAATLALSPDGRNLAFVTSGVDGQSALWVRPLDSLEARRLEGAQDAAFPFWSPDGRSIGFFAGGKLLRIDSHGGAPQVLCDAAQARGGTWSADGTVVFSTNLGGELDRVAEAGGQPAALTQFVSHKADSFRWPFFLPDGRHFLYYILSDDSKLAGIHVGSLESRATSFLTASDSGAVFSDGFLYYSHGDRLVRQAFDARSLRLAGEAVPIADGIRFETIASGATALTAASGTLAYVGGGMAATDLLWFDRSGRPLGRIGSPGSYIEPALSPDGRWLAVSHFDPRFLTVGVWAFDLERGSLAPVSPSASFAATPIWSPDANRLVYSKFPSGGIYVRDLHGTQPERLLVATPTFVPIDDWSRDGRSFMWDSIDWKSSHVDLVVHDLANGPERRFVESRFNQSGGRFSPDGKWIAYESTETGTMEIFVRGFPVSDQRSQVSVGGGNTPRWRGDGNELYYVSADRKIMAVEIRTDPKFDAGAPRALFQSRIIPNIEARNNYDVTADGQRFVVNSRRPEDLLVPITVILGGSKQ